MFTDSTDEIGYSITHHNLLVPIMYMTSAYDEQFQYVLHPTL